MKSGRPKDRIGQVLEFQHHCGLAAAGILPLVLQDWTEATNPERRYLQRAIAVGPERLWRILESAPPATIPEWAGLKSRLLFGPDKHFRVYPEDLPEGATGWRFEGVSVQRYIEVLASLPGIKFSIGPDFITGGGRITPETIFNPIEPPAGATFYRPVFGKPGKAPKLPPRMPMAAKQRYATSRLISLHEALDCILNLVLSAQMSAWDLCTTWRNWSVTRHFQELVIKTSTVYTDTNTDHQDMPIYLMIMPHQQMFSSEQSDHLRIGFASQWYVDRQEDDKDYIKKITCLYVPD